MYCIEKASKYQTVGFVDDNEEMELKHSKRGRYKGKQGSQNKGNKCTHRSPGCTICSVGKFLSTISILFSLGVIFTQNYRASWLPLNEA